MSILRLSRRGASGRTSTHSSGTTSATSTSSANRVRTLSGAVDVLDQALDKKVDIVEDAIKRHNVEHAPAVQNDKDGEGGGGAKVKTFAIRMETTPEEFWDIVSRDEDEALKALSAEDLTEVFEFVCLSFALP